MCHQVKKFFISNPRVVAVTLQEALRGAREGGPPTHVLPSPARFLRRGAGVGGRRREGAWAIQPGGRPGPAPAQAAPVSGSADRPSLHRSLRTGCTRRPAQPDAAFPPLLGSLRLPLTSGGSGPARETPARRPGPRSAGSWPAGPPPPGCARSPPPAAAASPGGRRSRSPGPAAPPGGHSPSLRSGGKLSARASATPRATEASQGVGGAFCPGSQLRPPPVPTESGSCGAAWGRGRGSPLSCRSRAATFSFNASWAARSACRRPFCCWSSTRTLVTSATFSWSLLLSSWRARG